MLYSHKFTDSQAKATGVEDNTVDMIFLYFYDSVRIGDPFFNPTPDDRRLTRNIIREWVRDRMTFMVTFADISDFVSRLVSDYRENKLDLAETHWMD